MKGYLINLGYPLILEVLKSMENEYKPANEPEWVIVESQFGTHRKKAFYRGMKDGNCLGYRVSVAPEYMPNMLSVYNKDQWSFPTGSYKEAKKKYLSLLVN